MEGVAEVKGGDLFGVKICCQRGYTVKYNMFV